MSNRRWRLARKYARSAAGVFDEAFEKQIPRWLYFLELAMPMHDVRSIFQKPLARWREKMAKPNAQYKAHGLKILARKARRDLKAVQP